MPASGMAAGAYHWRLLSGTALGMSDLERLRGRLLRRLLMEAVPRWWSKQGEMSIVEEKKVHCGCWRRPD